MFSIFAGPPPLASIPEVQRLSHKKILPAMWEKETFYCDLLEETGVRHTMKCAIHGERRCPMIGASISEPLRKAQDRQFLMMLHWARPLASLLKRFSDKKLAGMWIKHLCSLPRSACNFLRGIRNDYMMCLMGYLTHQELHGPFLDYPVAGELVPLAEAAKIAAAEHELMDPYGVETNSFLSRAPKIPRGTPGAFAFVAITGDGLTDICGRK